MLRVTTSMRTARYTKPLLTTTLGDVGHPDLIGVGDGKVLN